VPAGTQQVGTAGSAAARISVARIMRVPNSVSNSAYIGPLYSFRRSAVSP
jgi:hypothetical protein